MVLPLKLWSALQQRDSTTAVQDSTPRSFSSAVAADDQLRQVAKAMLKVKGVVFAPPGKASRHPRFRR